MESPRGGERAQIEIAQNLLKNLSTEKCLNDKIMVLHLYSTIHPNKTKRFTNINELRHSVFKGIHIQFEV